jgi:CRISPR type III-A-associated RAMP protein Csm5
MQQKHFNVKLTVETPIHIGNAEFYTPTDYDIQGNEFYVIDQKKFLKKISSDKVLYNDFLKNCEEYNTKNTALLKFIRDKAKNLYKYTVKIDEKAKDYITRNPDEISRAPIDKFIRNNLDDTVYIPGSAVKGAIRSSIIEVIFRKLLKEEGDLCKQKSVEREKILESINSNNQRKSIETILHSSLGFDAKDDILKYVLVSDFSPLSAETQICFPVNKIGDNQNDIKALLECVMPKSSFEGTITFKKEFFDSFNRLLNKIKQEVKDFPLEEFNKENYKDFDEKTLEKWIRAHYGYKVYKCEEINNKITYSKNDCLIKLGKHAGAVSKTIAGLRKITIKGKSEPQFSQTSFWYVDNKPMGWVRVEFNLVS